MEQQNKPTRLTVSFDLRIIIAVLLVIIATMLALWRPWSDQLNADRTIKVTGEAKLRAEPNEFVFYPSYQFKNADSNVALNETTEKSREVVAKLKELGVADNKIKTNADGNNYEFIRDNAETITYTLRLTITLDNKELAQKVQDYLLTTKPLGTISPQATFSDAKRKELESQARDEATKDARAKADQSARNLGFSVGKVKSIEDGAGFGDVYPLARGEIAIDSAASSKMSIQPGENEISYSVSVTYFVR